MEKSNKPLINIIIGIVLVIIGILWYFVRIPLITDFVENAVPLVPLWKIIAVLIIGVLGVCIFFVGLILGWMGWEDYKMEREMAGEKAPAEKKKKPEAKEEELEKELKEEMSEGGEEFVCEVCGKTAKTKGGLKAHMRSHK